MRLAIASRRFSPALVAMLGLAACGHPVEKTEDIRPVRAITLAAEQSDVIAQYAGDIRARIEARLGFRVPGKIVNRKVDLGATVKAGQLLAQLDPQDLKLAEASARAQLGAARTDRDLAQADLKRYTELKTQGFVSGAEIERRQNTLTAAEARVEQAQAALSQQGNQAGYASLVADQPGVVTGIEAEVGQVVTAGQPVVRVAQTAEKEVVIAIPEAKVNLLRQIGQAQVRVWARPDRPFMARVREIAPAADPITRTYATRLSIPDAPADVLLGMTATVTFAGKTPTAGLRVPLTALYQEKGVTAVWVVDAPTSTVRLVPVRPASAAGNDIVLAGGVSPGQIVVTAGVHKLKPGQKVRLLDVATAMTPAMPPGMPPATASVATPAMPPAGGPSSNGSAPGAAAIADAAR